MVPSGVAVGLSSSNWNSPTSASVKAWGTDAHRGFRSGANAGGQIGSVNLSSVADYSFVMYLNGHKATGQYPNIITASFNALDDSNYFSKKFNTDPTKILNAGHYLYTHYDIRSQQAVITGSGTGGTWIISGSHSTGGDVQPYRATGSLEPVAFLMTSSLGRNATGNTTKPNFENFGDRVQNCLFPVGNIAGFWWK